MSGGAATHLAHVKDLDTVVGRLAADDDVVLVAADFPPDGRGCPARLGEPAEVDQLSGRSNLGKGRAVLLRYDDEFPAGWARPAPGGGTLAVFAAEVGVADEVVEVDLFGVSYEG